MKFVEVKVVKFLRRSKDGGFVYRAVVAGQITEYWTDVKLKTGQIIKFPSAT